MPGPSVHYLLEMMKIHVANATGRQKLRTRHELKQMVTEVLLKIVVFTFDKKLFHSIGVWTYLYGMI